MKSASAITCRCFQVKSSGSENFLIAIHLFSMPVMSVMIDQGPYYVLFLLYIISLIALLFMDFSSADISL